MDFAFSEEQEMLRSQARQFLAERVPHDRVIALAEADSPFDPDLWSEMAGLGWTSLTIPEEQGGSGMTFLDEAPLFEELGYALYPGPFFSTVALALPAMSGGAGALRAIAEGTEAATVAFSEPDHPHLGAARLETTASGSAGAWKLSGEKILVSDLDAASFVVVSASTDEGPGLWLVRKDEPGVSWTVSSTMDSTRRLGTVRLTEAEAEVLVRPGEAAGVFESIRLKALAALALEATGVAQRVLELAIDYTKTREQFGKPIGTYQAVSHQVADTYMEVELARSLAYWAAWAVAERDERAEMAVAAAKAACGEAAVVACERSIQVHGGIGFTWEHILHRYYKRAQWIDSFDGFGSRHRAAVAAALLDT